jgi:hypothetical protein
MKPNHHWAVHMADQNRDFATVNHFWAFLTERLNKILKNVNNNNWGGGQLEICMMRAFGRDSRFETIVSPFSPCGMANIYLLQAKEVHERPDHPSLVQMIDRMLNKDTEERGTVQASTTADIRSDFDSK